MHKLTFIFKEFISFIKYFLPKNTYKKNCMYVDNRVLSYA